MLQYYHGEKLTDELEGKTKLDPSARLVPYLKKTKKTMLVVAVLFIIIAIILVYVAYSHRTEGAKVSSFLYAAIAGAILVAVCASLVARVYSNELKKREK